MLEHPIHHHYTVYGLKLCSSLTLAELPPAAFEQRDVRFVHEWSEELLLPFSPVELIDRRPTNLGCDISVHRTHEGFLLDWDGLCRFHVSEDGGDIMSSAGSRAGYGWVTATLYGMVLSFALHLRGAHNLHASAVTLADGAVGFLADPGSGKSSLAAAFAANGNPFLTDDVLALRTTADGYLAHPGFPYASLSAQAVRAFQRESVDTLPLNDEKRRVRIDGKWATFAEGPVPLQGLFSLHRDTRANAVDIRRLPLVEAVQCLIENTNVFPLMPLDVKQSQLAFVGRLANEVPVWRLTYPSGFDRLHEVIEAVSGLSATRTAQTVVV